MTLTPPLSSGTRMVMETAGFPPDPVAEFEACVNPALGRFLRMTGRDRIFTEARGLTLVTKDGEVFQDWLAGFGSLNLGHNPPEVRRALGEYLASGKPQLFMEAINPPEAAAARLLVEGAGPGYAGGQCFFSNSGSEGVEAALKLARAATRRPRFLYCENAYHGTTLGALSMMGEGDYRQPFEPLLPGFTAIPFGDTERLVAELRQGDVAALVLEPIQMEAGMVPLPPEVAQAIEALCRTHGTLVIYDEVQTGMGRTGPLFAFQALDTTPDIFVVAKSLGGGMVPVGATVSVAGLFERAYGTYLTSEQHNSTFGGNALAMVAARTTVEILLDPDHQAARLEVAEVLAAELESGLAGHPLVERVTIRGFLAGVGLVDPEHPWFTWESFGMEEMRGMPVAGPLLVHRLYKRGILTQICGHAWNTLRVEPPLTVTAQECRDFCHALREELDWIAANA